MAALVITLIGPDRPGLLGLVADVVRQHGGNWLDSRMAHLAGQFAGIVQVDVAEHNLDGLIAALKQLDTHGLRFLIENNRDTPPPSPGTLVSLSVIGNDRPGIVQQVSQVLAAHSVNVEEFDTEITSAPVAGGKIFRADAKLCLPQTLTLDQLQEALERIATDLMVDIAMHSDES